MAYDSLFTCKTSILYLRVLHNEHPHVSAINLGMCELITVVNVSRFAYRPLAINRCTCTWFLHNVTLCCISSKP